MNGQQIEKLLSMIECNVDFTRAEAAEFIHKHAAMLAKSLVETGSATVRTRAGDLRLTMKDLVAN